MNLARLVAAAAFGLLAAERAEALRPGPAGLQASPSVVRLSRTVTVTLELEDDQGDGSSLLDTIVEAEPGRAVRLVEQQSPPSFGCTGTGTVTGRWVFETLAPGTVTFKARSSLLSCTEVVESKTEAESAPVTIEVPPIDSRLRVEPRFLGPGERVVVTLVLRNDGAEAVHFAAPGAAPELGGVEGVWVHPAGGPTAEPADALRDGRLRLPPGREVSVRWSFEAVELGTFRFQILAAGLLIYSPDVTIRHPAFMELHFNEPEPSAVGQEYTYRGYVTQGGQVAVDDVTAALSWAPREAAALRSARLSTTGPLDQERYYAEAVFRLELLKPGRLSLTVTAGGREVDTGRPVAPEPLIRALVVDPPPEIAMRLSFGSATLMQGREAPFTLSVENAGGASTERASPIVVVREGRAAVQPLVPSYQAVARGTSATFAGRLVPEAGGPLAVFSQMTTRGVRGGGWVTFSSQAARLAVLPAPRIELHGPSSRRFADDARSWSVRLRNASAYPVALDDLDLSLATDGAGQADVSGVSPRRLRLAPGESATVTFGAELPEAAGPFMVRISGRASGRTLPDGLPISERLPSRPLGMVCPPRNAVFLVEPSPVFRPPLDPVCSVEFSLTGSGGCALGIVDASGAPVRGLAPYAERAAGFHRALWDGRDDSGKPVAPGTYRIRLSGPPAAGVAGWRADAPVTVERP